MKVVAGIVMPQDGHHVGAGRQTLQRRVARPRPAARLHRRAPIAGCDHSDITTSLTTFGHHREVGDCQLQLGEAHLRARTGAEPAQHLGQVEPTHQGHAIDLAEQVAPIAVRRLQPPERRQRIDRHVAILAGPTDIVRSTSPFRAHLLPESPLVAADITESHYHGPRHRELAIVE